MGSTVQQIRARRDADYIADRMGHVPIEDIARGLGRTPKAVLMVMERRHLAPTRDAGYVTLGELSREYLPLSVDTLRRKCRCGEVRAKRNRTHRQRRQRQGWWLVNVDDIPALQARYGARHGAAVNWQPGTPRWMHRETTPPPAHRPDPLFARKREAA